MTQADGVAAFCERWQVRGVRFSPGAVGTTQAHLRFAPDAVGGLFAWRLMQAELEDLVGQPLELVVDEAAADADPPGDGVGAPEAA
jgi:hypothetical protein